ncbi:MAG: hypothetical protein HQL32_12435, partial [Planctomycetes bacterium]|nr:hypothetical protein [Planctomycetota bacterium]
SNWFEMSAGPYHNLAFDNNGDLYAWGHNGELQSAGSKSVVKIPMQVNLPALAFPRLRVIPHKQNLTAGENVALSALSTINDGSVSWNWTMVSSPSGSSPTVLTPTSSASNVNLNLPGTYQIQVQGTGSTNSSMKLVTVEVQPAVLGTMVWGVHTYNAD